jgi:ribonuclease P protein component
MKKYGLSKAERIKTRKEVKLLFDSENDVVDVYPLKVIYRWETPVEEKPFPKILVSVSHKKIRRAVKRNLIKRRVREAYRTNKGIILDIARNKNKKLLIAFVYISSSIKDYEEIKKAVTTALQTIANRA